MKGDPTYRYDSDNARCAGNGRNGRCQLRGTVGWSNADGGRWFCAWHSEVQYGGTFPSYENFTAFINEQKEAGITRWDRRTIEDWWNLAQGQAGSGSFSTRPREEVVSLDETREVPGY